MFTKKRSSNGLITPIVATALIFFIAEIAVMSMLAAFALELSPFVEAVVDALFLVTISLPFLWFFVIRPFYQVAITTGQQWENLLEAAPEGILGVGRDGNIRFANKYAERVFGYRPEELVGKPIEMLVPQRFSHGHVKLRDKFFKSPSPRAMGQGSEVFGRRRDGAEFPAYISLNLIPSNGEPVVLTIVRDISAQKATEHELREANEKLLSGVQQLTQNAQLLQFLMEFGSFLQRCSTEQELYTVVSRYMRHLFPERAGAMFVLAPTKDLVEPVHAWGMQPGAQSFAPDLCWALRRGQIHSENSDLCGMPCTHLAQDSSRPLCVPLVAQEGTVGLLHFVDDKSDSAGDAKEDGTRNEMREQLFRVASEQVTMALVNLRLRTALRDQSIRDPLTQLYNRRYFDQTLEREISRTKRAEGAFSIVMLDVDHFKRINDRHGHDGGDEVLKAVARVLIEEVRTADVPCRIGGEEFCIIAPDTPLAEAGELAERLRQRLKEVALVLSAGTLDQINASFGVAEYPRQARDAKELLSTADNALYKAKEAGRDRIVLAFKASAAAA